MALLLVQQTVISFSQKNILLSMIRFRTHFALFTGNCYRTQIIEAFKFSHDLFCHPRHVTSVSFVFETVFVCALGAVSAAYCDEKTS